MNGAADLIYKIQGALISGFRNENDSFMSLLGTSTCEVFALTSSLFKHSNSKLLTICNKKQDLKQEKKSGIIYQTAPNKKTCIFV